MGAKLLSEPGVCSLVLERAHYSNCAKETCSLLDYVLDWRGNFFAFILSLESGGDIATFGATFVAKWHNTTSYYLAFVAKWHDTGSYFATFTKRLSFFGGRECSTSLTTKFCFLEGCASRLKGGGCSVGDATVEPRDYWGTQKPMNYMVRHVNIDISINISNDRKGSLHPIRDSKLVVI